MSFDGIGLHTGTKSTLNILPAEGSSGIIFKRTDLISTISIPADIQYVVSTNRGTVLECDGARVHTVEHILSALSGLGINNAVIEVSGPEPPIMDGSALPFVKGIKTVGILEQNVPQAVFKITEPIQFSDPKYDIEINILPAEQLKITFFMDYGSPNFGLQYTSVENVDSEFEQEIAPARTFGLLSEIAELKQSGLIKGGSLDNAVVIVDEKVDKKNQKTLSKLFGINSEIEFNKGTILNTGGFHFENEPVRHKVLDLIGDMSLFGKPIIGHIIAKRSGHRTNIELLKKLRRIANDLR